MREYLPLGSTDAETAALGESLLSPRAGGGGGGGGPGGGGARKARFGTPRAGAGQAAGLQPLYEGPAGGQADVEGGLGGGGGGAVAMSPRTPASARCGEVGGGPWGHCFNQGFCFNIKDIASIKDVATHCLTWLHRHSVSHMLTQPATQVASAPPHRPPTGCRRRRRSLR